MILNSNPYFSIVIPTYNRANLIGKTLDSILLQRFTDFEVIVVDDGSRDNTQDVVKGYSDSRIRYYKKENGERGAARNYGRKLANGNYINFFDSDDLMYPNHLQVARAMTDQWRNPELFYLGYDFKNGDGVVTEQVNTLNDQSYRQAMFDNFLSCNGVFLRKDIADAYPFEEDRKLASAEDWELWIRLMSRYPLRYSNEITTSVINHDQRSLRTIATEKIVLRDEFLIENLRRDVEVLNAFGSTFAKFVSQRYTFFMLCCAEDKNRGEVFRWAMRAARIYPLAIFSKRFVASIKKTIL